MNRREITYLAVLICITFGISWMSVGGRASTSDALDCSPVSPVYSDTVQMKIIDSAANVVSDAAGSLKPFWAKLQRVKSGSGEVVSVIHLGDSHVQAGFWDARLRELFQADFGDAGRGLIVPHRLSGSNEPRDYAILTGEKYESGRATSRDLAEKIGMTGVAIGIEAVQPQLKIWSKEPFNSVTVLHHSKAPAFSQPDSLVIGSYCTIGNTPGSTRIELPADVDSISLEGVISSDFNNPTIYGFSLENGNPGVLIHTVGVNGAAFEHFEKNTDFLDGRARELSPDLIIISLGTNNCFGNNFRGDAFRETAQSFIVKVKDNYPGTAILVTTPMEACRRSRRTYVVNKNVADVARQLEAIARDNGVACWNFYDAAGGAKSNSVWFGQKLVQGDRLHLTEAGYMLQGEMLYDAMMRGYNAFVGPQTSAQSTAEHMHERESPEGNGNDSVDAGGMIQNGVSK